MHFTNCISYEYMLINAFDISEKNSAYNMRVGNCSNVKFSLHVSLKNNKFGKYRYWLPVSCTYKWFIFLLIRNKYVLYIYYLK